VCCKFEDERHKVRGYGKMGLIVEMWLFKMSSFLKKIPGSGGVRVRCDVGRDVPRTWSRETRCRRRRKTKEKLNDTATKKQKEKHS
jgi:hypothetical protein